ncbi:hypothetical protein RRG08_010347 [Elysia crispata]|uniref:Uncharacterized protein n=1 Tax=Elysia crispata TaxID=231223 RepID=A0AAE1E6X9_9GAST|nr:hypothetical protein RRG08_010347 [Elysia crispata]
MAEPSFSVSRAKRFAARLAVGRILFLYSITEYLHSPDSHSALPGLSIAGGFPHHPDGLTQQSIPQRGVMRTYVEKAQWM